MARGGEGMAKRAREKARQERQEVKRQRRQTSADQPAGEPVDETGLMEEFRQLSESHAKGEVDDKTYAAERHRIFVALGLEQPEE